MKILKVGLLEVLLKNLLEPFYMPNVPNSAALFGEYIVLKPPLSNAMYVSRPVPLVLYWR